jgi:cytochrome c
MKLIKQLKRGHMRNLILISALGLGAVIALNFVTVVSAQETDEFAYSSRGDASKGRRLFARCRTCHNLTGEARPRIGPNLNEVFGRTAGTSSSFTRYSDQMKTAGIVWSEETMFTWLTDPRALIPGNKMVFPGLRREQDRLDMIAYLREATITE